MGKITSVFRSACAMAALGLMGSAPPLSNFFMPHSDYRNRGAKGRRKRTGCSYPHSSTRQRARYARQIAAGRLVMEGIDRVQ